MYTLTISDISIRQDNASRFCLNDLHKAAGSEKRHQPSDWIRIKQTQELIAELESCDPVITGSQLKAIETIKGNSKGKQQGTYAVKELVYAYAMWISAKFHIAVIRAYDAMVASQPAQQELFKLPFATKAQREPLVKAVRQLVKVSADKGRALTYENAHSLVNMQLGIASIDQLKPEDLPTALKIVGNLLQKVILEGEYMPKETQQQATVQPGPETIELISYKQAKQLRDEIDVVCKTLVWLYNPSATAWLTNSVRVMFNIADIADLPAHKFNAAMKFITLKEPEISEFFGFINDIKVDFFRNVLGNNTPFTPDLKRKYLAKFGKKLTDPVDWKIVQKALTDFGCLA